MLFSKDHAKCKIEKPLESPYRDVDLEDRPPLKIFERYTEDYPRAEKARNQSIKIFGPFRKTPYIKSQEKSFLREKKGDPTK